MSRPDYQILLPNKNKDEHSHDYAQVLIPLKNTMELRCQGQKYLLHPEEIAFLIPDLFHQCMGNDEIITINIPKKLIKKGDLSILSGKIVIPIEGPLIPLTQLISMEIKRNNASMRYLYYFLYDVLVERNNYSCIRFIRGHFDEPISVAKLATMENYNITYFNHWFKKQTGYTPFQYLRLFRIEKAKELLLHTGYNVLDIAVQVGYNSNDAFTRAFKKLEGISPVEYRIKAK